MKATRKWGICLAATLLLLVQSMIGCAAMNSGNNASNMPSGETSSEVVLTATPKPTANPTLEPTQTPDKISDEHLVSSWTEFYNALYSKFADYSTTAENCMADKKSITWSSFIYPWRNDMDALKVNCDELVQASQNGSDDYTYKIVIDSFNSAYSELMTCWMIASDVIKGDSVDEEFDITSHAVFLVNTQNSLNNAKEWLIVHGATQDAFYDSTDNGAEGATALQTEASNENAFDELVKALNGVWVERSTSTFGTTIYFQISGTTVGVDDNHFNNSYSSPTFFMFGTLEEGNGCAICCPDSTLYNSIGGRQTQYEFSLDGNGNLVIESTGDIDYRAYEGTYDRVE